MIDLLRLEPEWILLAERVVGVRFSCPKCSRWGASLIGVHSVGVLFANPADGGPTAPNDESIIANYSGLRWTRSGDTFESLTLSPSIDLTRGDRDCWHGFINSGIAT